MRYEIKGTLGDWTFYQVTEHGFTSDVEDRPLYGFAPAIAEGAAPGKPQLGELYRSLEHAMVAAVGQKYTGRRGAGGTGVDTAAGWFMKMIGADQLVPMDNRDARGALIDSLEATGGDRAVYTRASSLGTELGARGVILAKLNTP